MKRIVALLLLFAMALSLCACASSGTHKDNDKPKGEDEQTSDAELHKVSYAVASESDLLIFTDYDPDDGLGNDNAEVLNAIKSNRTYSNGQYSDGRIYRIEYVTEDFTDIYRMEQVAEITVMLNERKVELTDSAAKVGVTDGDKADIAAMFDSFDESTGIDTYNKDRTSLLRFKGLEVLAVKASKATCFVYAPVLVAMTSRNNYDHDNTEEGSLVDTYAFRHAYETAIANGEKSFTADGTQFTVETDEDGSSVLKDGRLFAYVSNMKVTPEKTRAGIELDLEFKNKVRSVCREMSASGQSGMTFTHEVWVKECVEAKTMNGNLINEDDSKYEEYSPYRYGVLEIAAGNGYRYFAILDDNGIGKTVELAVEQVRSAVTQIDEIGTYYIPADDANGRIYTKWPAIANDNDGMYYIDGSGNKNYVESTYDPAGNVTYKLRDTGEAVTIINIEAKETEDGFVVTDQNGNTINIVYSIGLELVRKTDEEGNTYYMSVDGQKIYESDIGVQTERSSKGEERMFVWVIGEDATADDLQAKRVYIKTSKVFGTAKEGEEGVELRTMKFEVEYGSGIYKVYIWLEDGMSL